MDLLRQLVKGTCVRYHHPAAANNNALVCVRAVFPAWRPPACAHACSYLPCVLVVHTVPLAVHGCGLRTFHACWIPESSSLVVTGSFRPHL